MSNIIRLAPEGASYKAEYHWTTYRFLLSNGNTMDVSAVQDDSWLRNEVLKIVNDVIAVGERTRLDVTIVGVAKIDATSTTRLPVKKAVKKAVKR